MTTTAATPSGRLGNGQLRRQVAAWLDANPGSHTPAATARALNRSSGAVVIAAATLARLGQADVTAAKPVRYQGNATTAGAARGAIPGPPPPKTVTARRAPAPAPATAGKRGPVTRPGGAVYIPRALAVRQIGSGSQHGVFG